MIRDLHATTTKGIDLFTLGLIAGHMFSYLSHTNELYANSPDDPPKAFSAQAFSASYITGIFVSKSHLLI